MCVSVCAHALPLMDRKPLALCNYSANWLTTHTIGNGVVPLFPVPFRTGRLVSLSIQLMDRIHPHFIDNYITPGHISLTLYFRVIICTIVDPNGHNYCALYNFTGFPPDPILFNFGIIRSGPPLDFCAMF